MSQQLHHVDMIVQVKYLKAYAKIFTTPAITLFYKCPLNIIYMDNLP